MALAENNIVELVVNQRYFGKDLVNVFYYGITNVSGTVTVSDVCERFDSAVIIDWDQNCNEGLTFESVDGRELVVGEDIGSYYSGRSGQVEATEANRLPPFIALSIKFPRKSQSIRSGFSRFAGNIVNNVIGENWSPSTLSAWATTGGALTTPHTVTAAGGGCTMAPVTLGRLLWEGKYILDLSRFDARDSYAIQSKVTTQNSRKD